MNQVYLLHMFKSIFRIIIEVIMFPLTVFFWIINIPIRFTLWIIEKFFTIISLPFLMIFHIISNIDDFLLTIIKSPYLLIKNIFSKNDESYHEDISYDKINSRYIPQRIKDQVWNRDGGKCIRCGSNEKIEFDHIRPIVRGGKSTYRNLQLLCESCNRSKGAKIE